jgi:outer membrane protein assembly factor BamB
VRIRGIALLVALLVVATGCDWEQLGFGAAHTGTQPVERTIGPTNVAGLTQTWSAQIAGRMTPISPAVVGGVVYMAAEGFVYAVDAHTGVRLWKAPVSGFFPSSPAVSDGVVYVAGDRLQAFAAGGCGAKTCAALWTSDVFPSVSQFPPFSGSPAVSGGVVYVDAIQLLAYDASGCGAPTCAPLWSSPSNAPPGALGTPAVVNGVVYTTHGGVSAFAASGCGAAECAPLWTATVDGFPSSGPAVAGGIVFVPSEDSGGATGTLTAFRVADCSAAGCAPLWKAHTGGHSNQFVFLTPDNASAAIAGSVVYAAANEAGKATLYAFRATGCGMSTCSPLWTGQAPGFALSSPTSANGVVYLGTGWIAQGGEAGTRIPGALVAFAASGCGASTCAPLWQSAETTVESSAAIVNGAVYVATLPLASQTKGAIVKYQLPATSG